MLELNIFCLHGDGHVDLTKAARAIYDYSLIEGILMHF